VFTWHLTSANIYITSNVTGRHRGLKWKLRAGYRAPLVTQRHHYSDCPIYTPCSYVAPVAFFIV